MSRHYVFAGGGTGGHLYPGLAVAEALRAAEPDCRITFLTTDRPLDRQLLKPTGFGQCQQQVRPLVMHPFKLPGFLHAWRASVTAARGFLRDERPAAVLGLGGYAAGPPVVAAAGLEITTALLNPDLVPGRANRHLARRATRVFLQWPESRQYFRKGVSCAVSGCPIRAAFAAAARVDGCAAFGLDPQRPVLLVTGASQGARTINLAMQRVWPTFRAAAPAWQLLHLTGEADYEATRAAYAAAGVDAQVQAFTHEMPLAIAAADAVVSRSGASTLAELTALGRPSILLPYPFHRDMHQRSNARVLERAGAALLLHDAKEARANAAALLEALQVLSDDAVRGKMAAAARTLGRPDAAATVADWLRRAE